MKTNKKYTIQQLLRMPKQQLFELEMTQLPLPGKMITHFEKRASKGELIKLYYWVFCDTSYEQHLHRAVIAELLAKFGIIPYDVFTTGVLEGKKKSQIKKMSLEQLCFPYGKGLKGLIEKEWKYFKLPSQPRHGKLSSVTLDQLLNLDKLPTGPYADNTVSALGERALFGIRNHIFKLGFKKRSYPFLSVPYWEAQTQKHEQKIIILKAGLKEKYNCSDAETEKILQIAADMNWIPTHYYPWCIVRDFL